MNRAFLCGLATSLILGSAILVSVGNPELPR
jgi:hypothetical protein